MKTFLKWAGGKSRTVLKLKEFMNDGDRLVEPFVGSGAVFLNTSYSSYLLCDTNVDLINLYKNLKNNSGCLISKAESFFLPENNLESRYYELRDRFNFLSSEDIEKSALFIYLNKHAFNGLCRYNQSGAFNVPFGRYKQPKFPRQNMLNFSEKAKKAQFRCQDFEETFKELKAGDVVYCDPPYVPLSATSSFTTYSKNGFDFDDQLRLVKEALAAKSKGVQCIISNHDLRATREMYRDSVIHQLKVQRNISSKPESRKKVAELVAIF